MLSVILTPRLRRLPYFAAFSSDEETIEIPDLPYASRLIHHEEVLWTSFEEREKLIETSAYLTFPTHAWVQDLIWRAGDRKETHRRYFLSERGNRYTLQPGLSPLLRHEIQAVFSTGPYHAEDVYLRDTPSPSMKRAILTDNARMVRSLCTRVKLSRGHTAMAAQHGRCEALRVLLEHNCPAGFEVMLHAIRARDLGVAELAKRYKCLPARYSTYVSASTSLPFLVQAGLLTQGMIAMLARASDYQLRDDTNNLLESLTGPEYLGSELLLDLVIAIGTHDHLTRFLALGCTPCPRHMQQAARNGHVEKMTVLADHGCLPDASAYYGLSGYDTIRWLLGRGIAPTTEQLVQWTRIDIAMLEAVLECGVVPHRDLMPEVARTNQVETMALLHRYRAPWDRRTCVIAASYSHIDCLEYALDHGCPWDGNTFEHENPMLLCYRQAIRQFICNRVYTDERYTAHFFRIRLPREIVVEDDDVAVVPWWGMRPRYPTTVPDPVTPCARCNSSDPTRRSDRYVCYWWELGTPGNQKVHYKPWAGVPARASYHMIRQTLHLAMADVSNVFCATLEPVWFQED